jgi:hypothetical protein
MAKSKKSVPVDAVQELADKAAQAASIGGTAPAAESGEVDKEAEKPAAGQVQVNTDYLKTTKVHIAMPCYGGQLTESTFMSYIKFANMARQLGVDWTLETIVNESLISRARNTLTAKFLHAKDSSHLMFIDADIGWEAWHLLVLLNRTLDPKIKMIGGLYPMKTLPLKWVVNGFEGAEEGPDGLQEVSKTGTGFLLTAREVFGVMEKHPAVKPYKNDIGIDVIYDTYLKTYWDTAVREGRYLSEDWTACSNYRDMGGKVWVDKRVLLRHAGHFNFSLEAHNDLLDKYGKMYLEQQVNAGKVKMVDENGNILG